jgi:hypothetical protein
MVLLREWANYIVLDEQGINDKDWTLDIGGLNFEFLFSFESCWWQLGDYPKMGVLEKEFSFLNTEFWSNDRCRYFVIETTNSIFDIP